jgi:hypothetical protein
MATYRAYLLDPSGKITWGEWIEAADQAEAEAKAHAMCDKGTPAVELWLGDRRIAELPCDKPLRRKAG